MVMIKKSPISIDPMPNVIGEFKRILKVNHSTAYENPKKNFLKAVVESRV